MSGLNQTPKGERVHIALFGRRNAGKSSVINAITGQDLAVVSDVKGTTTDPVFKAMELLPLGPVTVIDTPGLDDVGELGRLRVEKANDVLNKTDIALVIYDITEGFSSFEAGLLEQIKKKQIPYLIVLNQADRYRGSVQERIQEIAEQTNSPVLAVSAKTKDGVRELKEKIASLVPDEEKRRLLGDLLEPGDMVVLVVPIDKAAPKGRLILPQQQAVRDILDAGAVAVVCQNTELKQTLQSLGKTPKLVVTDSQVFGQVAKDTPQEIPMTSFSILMARYKGELPDLIAGAKAVSRLQNGDTVLISEGCTHHRQCEDIGTVKIPKWLKEYTGRDIRYATSSGTEFPKELSNYKMVIHCGGCMLNRREMLYRTACCAEQGVPIVNYGILIACMKGILPRCIEPFADAMEAWKQTCGE